MNIPVIYDILLIFHICREMAVAVFKNGPVLGEIVGFEQNDGVQLKVYLTKLPAGKHGFHIHTAGDLRGEGCQGACAHWSKEPAEHGDYGNGHTGDLGNIAPGPDGEFKRTYFLKGVTIDELWGRTIIVHADEDDLGRGGHDDSKITGHSGKRIACAIFGRMKDCDKKGGGEQKVGGEQSKGSNIALGVLLGATAAGLGFLLLGSSDRRTRRSI